ADAVGAGTEPLQGQEEALGTLGEPRLTQLLAFAQLENLCIVDQFARQLLVRLQGTGVAKTHHDHVELLAKLAFNLDLRHRDLLDLSTRTAPSFTSRSGRGSRQALWRAHSSRRLRRRHTGRRMIAGEPRTTTDRPRQFAVKTSVRPPPRISSSDSRVVDGGGILDKDADRDHRVSRTPPQSAWPNPGRGLKKAPRSCGPWTIVLHSEHFR